MKYKDKDLLQRFIDEQFDLESLFEAGLLKPEMKVDYEAIADRLCKVFGYESIYQYGATEIRCHITFSGDRGEEPFVTELKSIYD